MPALCGRRCSGLGGYAKVTTNLASDMIAVEQAQSLRYSPNRGKARRPSRATRSTYNGRRRFQIVNSLVNFFGTGTFCSFT